MVIFEVLMFLFEKYERIDKSFSVYCFLLFFISHILHTLSVQIKTISNVRKQQNWELRSLSNIKVVRLAVEMIKIIEIFFFVSFEKSAHLKTVLIV